MPDKKTERYRRAHAREAAHTSWDRTTDRTARTEPGRNGLSAKIIGDLIAKIGEHAWAAATPAQREEWATAARSEHFSQVVRARWRARAARLAAVDHVARLREFLNDYYANIDDSAHDV